MFSGDNSRYGNDHASQSLGERYDNRYESDPNDAHRLDSSDSESPAEPPENQPPENESP